jgi:F-type H+-transporting ATPase subunit gamma
MSHRRLLEDHVKRLTELGEIMRSMKNLARMEQSKIGRLAVAQAQLIESIEAVARDFLAYHPEAAVGPEAAPHVVLLVGSQRGFCGDFNEAVLNAYRDQQSDRHTPAEIVVVGERLLRRLREQSAEVVGLDGPSVSEEIGGVLNRLLETLTEIQGRLGVIEFSVIHHRVSDGAAVRSTLLPPFQNGESADDTIATSPLLNVAPETFWTELVDQYLFSKLHETFYASLMVENQRRAAHLTGAVKHLDEKTEELRRKSRAMRQEEITEEIEVILLGADIERVRPDRV